MSGGVTPGRSRCLSRLSLCAAALLVVSLSPAPAHAAACCLSASVVGMGRLVVWEDAAAGLSTSYGHGTGRWDTSGRYRAFSAGLLEDELRVDAWAIVRLSETWQVQARVPWVTGVRASTDGTSSVGTGLGDVSVAGRWDAVLLGEYEHVPGIAVMASVVGPTGRRPEQATDPLGASATGRGAWAASLGLAAEYAFLPWFLRLDVAGIYTAPFQRADTGQWQGFGPGIQVGLSGGRELLAERLVVALAVRLEHELALTLGGKRVADSENTGLTTSLSASWKLTPHWMLTGAFSTDVLGRLGVAHNRADRLAFTLGVRHGFF